MSPAIVLTAAAAAVLVSGLANARCLNREGIRAVSTAHEPFEILANNLKAAANKVDNSAAEVEVALKGLRAA